MRPFRIKVGALWRLAFSGLVVGALLSRALLWVQGQPFSLPSTLPLMAVAAVLVALSHYLQPTLAGEHGVKAMNNWGIRRLVPWSDIRSVTFARMYFVQPALKLVDGSGRAHWIARDTLDLGALHAIAVRYGGAGHPLTRALETPLYAL